MHMRIIWGRIAAGQWDGFEAAYKKATALRGDVKGLKNQWLARDQGDPDAGYSITLWDSEADMRAFWDSKKREEAMALLPALLPQSVHRHSMRGTICAARVTAPPARGALLP